MPAVFTTRRVREALTQPVVWWSDLLLVLFLGAIIGMMMLLGRHGAEPFKEQVPIDLSLWALPEYTLLSLARGFAAYILSLLFTLTYGSYAAHHPRAEKVMLPALDVLQSIPVLGFLPGLVVAMIALFPTRELGKEFACIIMIFTGQVWNMTFSFHGSLKAIPTALRDAAAVHGLSGWQVFRLLEVPASMIGLVWNSMMSMAGGWFFLTVTEAFTLGKTDYRLPGIGSYMSEAIKQDNGTAIIAAIIAMTLMIVLVDQLLWRPLVAWSQRFRMEDVTSSDAPQSWVLSLVMQSHINRWLRRKLHSAGKPDQPPVPAPLPGFVRQAQSWWKIIRPVFRGLIIVAVLVGAGWGLWSLGELLFGLPLYGDSHDADWWHVLLALEASFLRTSSAVLLGMLWTLPVGILVGRSPRWSARLQPLIQVVASFPAPMFFPLVTIFLVQTGVPFTISCVLLMLLGTQWYILFNVIAGATAIPADLEQAATVYRLSRWQRWTKLYIPCVFPYLVTGLVTAAGGAWNATIVSEYVQTSAGTQEAFGLGSIISKATAEGNFSLLAAGVVTMAVAVVALNRFWWKRLYVLTEERYRLQV